MPYNLDRGCSSSYTGCGAPFHGFSAGVCTDIVQDAYKYGASIDLQMALSQDNRANPGRYRYGTARYAEDLRRYFSYNQQTIPHTQPYLKGDVAFFDWDNDGLIDHSAVISLVDWDGRPLGLVDAPGYSVGNPAGKSIETTWSSIYESYVKDHGRLGTPPLLEPITTTATLQVLRIDLDAPSLAWRLQDKNGRGFSETDDENLIASNVHAFIPYIPGASYAEASGGTVITITQPLENTDQYSLELTATEDVTYTLNIATLQNSAHTQGSPTTLTQLITAGATHDVDISLEMRQGEIRFKSTPTASPVPLVGAPAHLELTAFSGSTAQLAFEISELGGILPLNNASLAASQLKSQMGGTISASRLSLSPDTFSLSPSASQNLILAIDLDGILPAMYQGSLKLTSGDAHPVTIPLTVIVEPYRISLPLLIRP
jgi:hypothetical protein